LPVLAEPVVPLYRGDMEADLRVVSHNRAAETITGGLSLTGKMPCPSWGISATRCRIGAALAGQAGTVCSGCYALTGRYRFPAVQDRLEMRYRGLFHPLWTPAMVFLVRYYCDRYFRLFDSGDLQGENHLRNIITLARHTPDVRIWLPTREYAVVRACATDLPENLTVRVSANRVDGEPPAWWPTTSTVISTADAGGEVCPAPDQENRCGDCRACWDRGVASVAYRRH
jgi:Gene product 88